MLDLREAKLTKKERDALEKSLRSSKRKPKSTAVVHKQIPPYAILPLLPYIPTDWIVWESAANKFGFLGEAIRALRGNVVIESGLELDGSDFLRIPPKMTAQVQITKPPSLLKYEWIERSYDNRQAFALLMSFDTWTADAQALFQRHGISVIILTRPILRKSLAWFTWGLPFLKQSVTYGYIPTAKNLPRWMVRPNHRGEITVGARSMQDRLAIRHATNPLQWPAPTNRKGGTVRPERK